VLFHGVNIVEKEFPWYRIQGHESLKNKTNFENLKKWGKFFKLNFNIFIYFVLI
jgi:hypothetical protein